MANRVELRTLGDVQRAVDRFRGSFDVLMRVCSMDGIGNAGEAYDLLDYRTSLEGGEWDVEELDLLQPLEMLHEYVLRASTLLEEIESALENQETLMVLPQLLRNQAVLILELDMSSLAASSFRTRAIPLPQRAISVAHRICDLAEEMLQDGDDTLARLNQVRRLGQRLGRFILKKVYIMPPPQEGPVHKFVHPRIMLPLNSLSCARALVESHGDEVGVRARLFCVDGIHNARKVFDLVRDRVHSRAWQVFNLQLLPRLSMLHDSLYEAQIECHHIACLPLPQADESFKVRSRRRLLTITDSIRGLDLSSLATCCFGRERARLPQMVSQLANVDLFYLAAKASVTEYGPSIVNKARTIDLDIGILLAQRLYLDPNPAPAA